MHIHACMHFVPHTRLLAAWGGEVGGGRACHLAFLIFVVRQDAELLRLLWLQEFHTLRPLAVNKLYTPPRSHNPNHQNQTNAAERIAAHHRADVWMLGISFGQLCNMKALCEGTLTDGPHTVDHVRRSLETDAGNLQIRPPLFDIAEAAASVRPRCLPACKKQAHAQYQDLVSLWCAHTSSV